MIGPTMRVNLPPSVRSMLDQPALPPPASTAACIAETIWQVLPEKSELSMAVLPPGVA